MRNGALLAQTMFPGKRKGALNSQIYKKGENNKVRKLTVWR